jgi:hypothetical protein
LSKDELPNRAPNTLPRFARCSLVRPPLKGSIVRQTGMNSNSELFALLDGLVDGWCERRALRPLRILLRTYPMVSPLSDSWHELRGALRDLRCLREPDISESDAAAIEDCLRAVETALGTSGWKLPKL